MALTWAAKRAEALENDKNLADRNKISTKTIVLYGLSSAAALGFIGSVITWGVQKATLDTAKLERAFKILRNLKAEKSMVTEQQACIEQLFQSDLNTYDEISKFYSQKIDLIKTKNELVRNIDKQETVIKNMTATGNTAQWMSVGFAAAVVVLYAFSAYMTYQDLKDFYKVKFSPIPHYMVDETDITYYNENGQQLVKENHAAYYKAAVCNRSESDDNYKVLGDCADLNGDVGQQWLALYVCRNSEVMQPILADSLKVVVGNSNIPAGYEAGIHMFGSKTAFNLNSKLYDWNQSAKSVFVYFQIDKQAPVKEMQTAGSSFTGGWLALTGVLGMGLGAGITALVMRTFRKKEEAAA